MVLRKNDKLEINGSVYIEPLSHATLKQASSLANAVFESEPGIRPSEEFSASLGQDPEVIKKMEEKKVKDIEYWVAVHENKLTGEKKVVGTTGLYMDLNEYPFLTNSSHEPEKARWLGWFCVDPQLRGKGIGTALLKYTINLAQKRGATFMRLYTSTHSSEKIAQTVYRNLGLKIIHVDPKKHIDNKGEEYQLVYRELRLADT
ncbi:MAG: GNAT family N-acetyltransferase [Promethearchaeota archaeon]